MIFMIIHGSWQASDGWQTVASLLKNAGFPVLLVDLPGHGTMMKSNFHCINLQTYVNHVCKIIQDTKQETQVILVGHSMAGMVISQVAQNMPVQQLIYVSAFLPIDGECLLDIAKRSPILGISKNMMIDPKRKSISLNKNGLEKLFYNDCHPDTIVTALSRLQDEPLLPFYGSMRLTEEKFGRIPKNYIECLQDFSISIELQRFMHNRWPCTVHSLESGHAPFYSVPEALARTLIECVQ